MEITFSRHTTIFLIEIVEQVWFFIILSTLKQYIVIGYEPIILVLNARFRSLKASVSNIICVIWKTK
jgi:hypothetical protein